MITLGYQSTILNSFREGARMPDQLIRAWNFAEFNQRGDLCLYEAYGDAMDDEPPPEPVRMHLYTVLKDQLPRLAVFFRDHYDTP